MTYIMENNDFLIHYGVKNMKWGVRRYQNKDGSLTPAGKIHYAVDTGGNSKFSKKYARDEKKLEKLTDKADIDLQRKNAKKYNEQALKAAKVGAKGLGVAGTALGLEATVAPWSYELNRDLNRKTQSVFKSVNDPTQHKLVNNLLTSEEKDTYSVAKPLAGASKALETARSIGTAVRGTAAIGGAAVGVGGATVAGVNIAKAKAAEYRTTPEGHAKAVDKRRAQYNTMYNTYKDTPYVDLLKKRNDQMKKAHNMA